MAVPILPAIDFRRIGLLLLSRWVIIVTVIALFIAAATWIVLRRPVTYRAKAVVQVEQEPAKVIVMQEVNPEDFKSIEIMKTIEQILTGRALLQRVVVSEKLTQNPRFMEPKENGEARTEDEAVGELSNLVESKLRRGTRLIDVTVEHIDPVLAQQLALALVREFDRGSFDQNLSNSRQASEYLLQEAEKLRAKLKSSEETLQQYCEAAGTVSLIEKQDIVVEKLKDLNLKVSDAKNARLKLEADMERLTHISPEHPEELLTLPSVANLPEVIDLKKQINAADGEMAAIKKRYLPEHPKYIHAAGQLKELNDSLRRVAGEAGELLRSSYAGVSQTEHRLEAALQDQEQLALQLNKLAIPYNVLSREVESDRVILESVLKRVKETEVSSKVEKSPIRVVEMPEVPTVPQSAKGKILMVALVLGTAVGVGSVLLIDGLDSSLRSVDQAEQMLGLASLAAIPEERKENAGKSMVVEHTPESAGAEAFRSLRASLMLSGGENAHRGFLITSSIPAEGKSYCALNCAAAFAQQGLRTLLIDADLRRPTQGEVFANLNKAAGLSEYLGGNAGLESCAHETGQDKLSLIPSGRQVSKPSELLSGNRFAELIREALAKYDRVVVDTAPVNAVSDALLIARHLEAVILVVRGGKTPARAVLRACRLLHRAGITPIGIVMSRLRTGLGAEYSYYDYSGRYATPALAQA